MKRALVVLTLGALSIGCGSEVRQGSLARVPMLVGPLGVSVPANVAVAPPRDVRPKSEHEGDEDRMKFFFTIAVVTRWERAGNYVTDDFAATANASGELGGALTKALSGSRAATVVPMAAGPAFVLETDIEHLYGTHYAVADGTIVIVPGGKRRGVAGGGGSLTTRQYASYGNVVLKARLIDRRGPAPVVIWEERIVGGGQAAPSSEHVESAQTALRAAASDAVAMVSLRVASALDRLGQGPNGTGYVLAGKMPPVFLLERVSRLRDFLELVYVETRSGLVIRHEIIPLVDHAYGRPGEWLLSRRTPEGITLSGEGYDAFARALASKYDIRAYDDVTRYHFFGVRGAVEAPNRAPE